MPMMAAGKRGFLSLLLFLAIVALPGTVSMDSEELTLESLRALGVFEVKFEGEAFDSYLARRRAVYFEWVYGEKRGDEWIVSSTGYRTKAPVVAVTPRGRIELTVNELRPHLTPVYTRLFTRADAREAPAAVAERLQEEESAQTVEEFCIEPGRVYHCAVQVERYHLPPRRGGERPVERQNSVLAISDLAFADGRPRLPITPSYRGFTY